MSFFFRWAILEEETDNGFLVNRNVDHISLLSGLCIYTYPFLSDYNMSGKTSRYVFIELGH